MSTNIPNHTRTFSPSRSNSSEIDSELLLYPRSLCLYPFLIKLRLTRYSVSGFPVYQIHPNPQVYVPYWLPRYTLYLHPSPLFWSSIQPRRSLLGLFGTFHQTENKDPVTLWSYQQVFSEISLIKWSVSRLSYLGLPSLHVTSKYLPHRRLSETGKRTWRCVVQWGPSRIGVGKRVTEVRDLKFLVHIRVNF